MCGRFVAAADPGQLRLAFDIDEVHGEAPPPSFNVAPTMDVRAVVEHEDRRHLVTFRWGLVPSWARDLRVGARMINARAETVVDKPAFRMALRRRRCIIPADAFYEWRRLGDRRVPHLVRHADGRPMAFAGLWETWRPADGDLVRSCTIVTTTANALVAPLHDRMPVVLARQSWPLWLDRGTADVGALRDLLRPCDPDDLECYRVSDQVNDYRNDHPGLIARLDPRLS